MALVPGRDYVLSPKTTYVGDSGIVYGCVVGLSDLLFLLPKDAIGGQGFTTTRTQFSLGGRPVLEAVEAMLQAPDTTREHARDVLVELTEGKSDALCVELVALKALRVKTGWFSRGIYFKKPEHSGWRGFPISGKEIAEQFAALYAGQLRE